MDRSGMANNGFEEVGIWLESRTETENVPAFL